MTLHPEFLVDSKGKKKKVVLSIREFNKLIEMTQDVMDAQIINEAKSEPRLPWEEVKAKLNKKRLG